MLSKKHLLKLALAICRAQDEFDQFDQSLTDRETDLFDGDEIESRYGSMYERLTDLGNLIEREVNG